MTHCSTIYNFLGRFWLQNMMQYALKSYCNELFFISTNEHLCTIFTKNVIISFLNKAVIIKKTLLFQYFVLKIEPS